MVDVTNLDELELYRDATTGRLIARDPSDNSTFEVPFENLEATDATVTNSLDAGSVSTGSAGSSGGLTVDGFVSDYHWELDGIFNATSSPTTYNLSGTYDHVLLVLAEQTGQTFADLRVNGDSNANYEYVDAGGTASTGETEFSRYITEHGLIAEFTGRWTDNFFVTNLSAEFDTSIFTGGRNTNVSSPLDSITVVGDSNGTKYAVYGRDGR